jgi:antimicrobial peptide system SdpB family protein
MKKVMKFIDANIDLQYIYSKKYAISRTLLSLSTFVTIAFNNEQRLFNISYVQNPNIKTYTISKLSIFEILYPDNLFLARIISCLILAFVIIGFLPRVTCFLQFWLSLSVYSSSYITEGGDQINMILSILIIPICLFDNRINHWNFYKNNENINVKSTVFFALNIIKLQVAILYFISGFGKLFNDQWREGSAMYYWIVNKEIGTNYYIEFIFSYIFSNRYILFFTTWFVMLFEISLSLIMLTNFNKKYFFYSALIFHAMIFIFFGLFSFELSMSAALFIYFLTFKTTKNEQLSIN